MNSTKSARLAIASAILLTAFQFSGCATTLTEDERYEREAERAKRTEEIRGFIAACEDAGNVALYEGPTTSKLRSPLEYIPSRAHISDYACVSQRQMTRALQ